MFSRFFMIFVAMALVACAIPHYAPTVDLLGQSRGVVEARLGPPADVWTLPEGVRLDYPKGPFGEQTYAVRLGADGRVMGWAQLLTEANFNAIAAGMTGDEVRLRIGRSYEIQGLARGRGEVWSYRYENPFCQWFRIELAADGAVRSTGYQTRPECDREWARWR